MSGYRYREPKWIVEVAGECPGCAAIDAEASTHPIGDRPPRVTLRPATAADYLQVDE